MTAQGQFGMVQVGGRVQFVETIPRNGARPVLHVADHPTLGAVRFDLDGARFGMQGMRGVLLGTSGSGKSYALGVIAEEAHRVGLPFVIFDQESEYLGLGALQGTQVVEVAGAGDGFGALVEFVLCDGGGLVLDVGELSLVDQRAVFVGFVAKFYKTAKRLRRRCLFFVDEAAEVAPQRKMRGADLSREWAERLARRGRKVGINWWMASQRPGDLDKSVYAQANVKLLGRIEIINDYQAIRPYLSRRIALAELARLDVGHFVLDIQGRSEMVQVRGRRTEDLGGTPRE